VGFAAIAASPEALQQAVADATERFEGKEIPRPEFWSGWRIVPTLIELWQQGDFRLHDRRVYARAGDGWDMTRLYP
jgi:pyridoxamine 5'-phosphate oxidase